jgi:2,3-dihydroxy-p-cumate/2,3-dihydroxybenzoate 3,4-dioxygenase
MMGGPSLRYSKLGYVSLNVTDVARSRNFYEKILGLEFSGLGPDGEVFLRCSSDHHNLVLHPSPRAGLRRLAWQMESERDIDRVVEIARAWQFPVEEVSAAECDDLGQERTVRFTEPLTSARMEYYCRRHGPETTAFEPTVAKIQRLGHVVLRTPDYKRAVEFFRDVLNFPISDTIEGRTTFMRCFPNPFHHSLGIGSGPKRALHHVNFMVSDIDDIGRAFWRMQKNDVPIVFGPGRHPPSDSIFLYFTDPDGITCEYSFGMEEFPELNPRPSRLLEPIASSIDDWDCAPPRFNPVDISSEDLISVPEVPAN